MKSIRLLRHGPVVNPENRIYGWRDVELLEPPEHILDIVSSERLEGIKTIVASDLKRCRLAAESLARRYNIPMIVTERIREQSFGNWEGLTWDEVKITDPVLWKRFFSDWIYEKPPKGESFFEMANRVWTFSKQIENASGGELWITHAGPIRVILCNESKKPLSSAFQYPCPYYETYHVFL